MIELAHYFKAYAGHPDITPEIEAAAQAMLNKVNELREMAAGDGVAFKVNPDTGTHISGQKNGGFRPQDCPIGAAKSAHKIGRGVDNYDPDRRFASWCLAHPDELKACGLWMEDPRWTPSWVHLQDYAPGSGKLVFIPSSAPALAPNPKVWA